MHQLPGLAHEDAQISTQQLNSWMLLLPACFCFNQTHQACAPVVLHLHPARNIPLTHNIPSQTHALAPTLNPYHHLP